MDGIFGFYLNGFVGAAFFPNVVTFARVYCGDCSLGVKDPVFVSIALRGTVVTVILFIRRDNIRGFVYSIRFRVRGYLLSGESRHLD